MWIKARTPPAPVLPHRRARERVERPVQGNRGGGRIGLHAAANVAKVGVTEQCRDVGPVARA